MQRFFFSLLLLLPIYMEAQATDKIRKAHIWQQMQHKDSIAHKIQRFKDSMARVIDSQQVSVNVQNNENPLPELQKEKKDRQRSAAIRSLAIGAAFLALLVIVWMKRRKKQG